jgi:two-component SAPR family response regulator
MSSRSGPIIIIDDDVDDQEILKEAIKELQLSNVIKSFSNCADALYYLMDTEEQPFLIICDINLPVMSGLEFRRKIVESDRIRKKSIPFVFLSTSSRIEYVEEAYDMMVQGYFKKPNTMQEVKEILKISVNYWNICLHPNI